MVEQMGGEFPDSWSWMIGNEANHCVGTSG